MKQLWTFFRRTDSSPDFCPYSHQDWEGRTGQENIRRNLLLRLWRTQDIQSIFRTNFIKTRTWKNTIRTIFKSARTKFENQKDDCRNTNSTEKRHCETELSLFWIRGFLRLCFEQHLLVTFQDFQNMWKNIKNCWWLTETLFIFSMHNNKTKHVTITYS